MGFCTEEQIEWFLRATPHVERAIVESGVILLKYWLEVSPDEQTRRLESRIADGRKIWKLSPMDIESYSHWYDYSRTGTKCSQPPIRPRPPWHLVRSDDKKRARLNIIRHLLSKIPYEESPREKVKLPKRSDKGAYDDQATVEGRTFVPEKY